MIEFEKGLNVAKVSWDVNGLRPSFRIDLDSLAEEPSMKGSVVGKMDTKRLKALLEYVDHRFRFNFLSPVTSREREQFLRFLRTEGERLAKANVRLTPEEIKSLKGSVREVNLALGRAAKSDDSRKAFSMALSYQYHDGFNHLTRDDDFIAVRCGNRIVAIIALPGNDYNELKNFIKHGMDRVLSVDNMDAFHRAYLESRKASILRKLEMADVHGRRMKKTIINKFLL